MDPEKIHAGAVFGKENKFAIPPYQRSYSWNKKNWQMLWDDMIEAYNNKRKHFLGTLVVVEKEKELEFEVVDGQQRLTTIYLLTAAIAASYGTNGSSENAMRLLHERIIYPYRGEGDPHRLALSNRSPANDHDNLKACIEAMKMGGNSLETSASRIAEAYGFFVSRIRKLRESKSSDTEGFVENALTGLQFLMIKLDKKDDDAQRVYRSINATGMKLTGADMIRNHVLMGINHADQERLYENHWSVLDEIFSDSAEKSFDSFVRFYIAIIRSQMKTGGQGKELLCRNESVTIFESFIDLLPLENSSYESTDVLLRDVVSYARCYQRVMANEKFCLREKITKVTPLDQFLRHHAPFRQNGFVPFFMQLVLSAEREEYPEKDILAAMRIVDGYVVRRTILKLDSNNYNAIGPEMWRGTQENLASKSPADSFATSTAKALSALTQAKSNAYPSDDRVRHHLAEHSDFGAQRIAKPTLFAIERHFPEHAEITTTTELEHVLPKNPVVGWEHIPDSKVYLDHLGNVTLNEKRINIANSNKPFADKREKFQQSPFQITQQTRLAKESEWTTDLIRKRANELAEFFLATWPIPQELRQSDHDTQHDSSIREYKRHLREDPAKNEQLSSLVTWMDAHEAYCLDLKHSMRCSVGGTDEEAGRTFAYLVPQKENLAIELPGEFFDFKEICDRYNLDSPYNIAEVGTISSGCDWRIKVPWGDGFHDAATALLEKSLSKTD